MEVPFGGWKAPRRTAGPVPEAYSGLSSARLPIAARACQGLCRRSMLGLPSGWAVGQD